MLKQTSLLLALLVLLSACGEDFLQRDPIDTIPIEDFFTTVDEFESATLAIYTAMQSQGYYGQSFELDDVPGDDASKTFSQGIDNFAANPNDGNIANYWREHYRAVTLANVVLEKSTQVPAEARDELSQEDLLPLTAEARFLRGLAYYRLVRLFGGVPLVTEIPLLGRDLLPSRATVDETYEFIIEDFNFAIEYLPSQHDPSRATQGAAQAFLADVHLTLAARGNSLGSYERSAELAQAVLESGHYEMLDSYGDLWIHPTSENTVESVFEIQFAGCGPWGTGNQRQAFFAPFGQNITGGSDGWSVLVPSAPPGDASGTTALDVWEEGDERRFWTLLEPGNKYEVINDGYTYPRDGVGGRPANIKKFVIGAGNDVCFMSTGQNASLMRITEVGLIYAEATARQMGGSTTDPLALEWYNAIRGRAGLESDTRLINVEDIRLERRREFMFEGRRWYDILRQGDEAAVQHMRLAGRTVTQDKLLLPIPALEIEVNPNLIQNPGY